MTSRPFVPGLVATVVAAACAAAWAGCAKKCCTVDGFPIALERAPLGAPAAAPASAPAGALLTWATSADLAGGQPFQMVIDTSAPITVFDGPARGQLVSRSFQLHEAEPRKQPRATFEGINTIQLPLAATGAAALRPLAILGGDLLRGYAVELRLAGACPGAAPGVPPVADGAPPVADGAPPIMDVVPPVCPSITFWTHQGANDGFLQDAGYAVLRFAPYGGGEVNIKGDPDFIGLRAPVELPPTRIVVRTCAAPDPFDRNETQKMCCKRGDEVKIASGVDLSLVLATGVGPVVLSRSAWARVAAKMAAAPAMTAGPLMVATWPTPIDAMWTTLPRMALVNLEAGVNDPGPCAELGRSRRLEWVSFQRVMERDFCAQPCDTDPRENDKAQNSAAYIELGGQVPVAVIADTEPLLQGIRNDVRPEGPEIDGLLGAGALGPTRLEIDFRNNPNRLIFSCEGAQPRDVCWTAARCPRLPDREHKHLCFGLPRHDLPQTCAPSGCPVQ